jgi:hypothetical protein
VVRLSGAIGYVGRQVGNYAIFFFFGDFWLPPAEGCLWDSTLHIVSIVSFVMFWRLEPVPGSIRTGAGQARLGQVPGKAGVT